jgi:uncharacterized protein (DUF302 family)
MSKYYVKPKQKVVIERFTDKYAEGVTKCFKAVYGKGYPIDTYINPEKLIKENNAKRVISIIAKTVNGEVVGHLSLFNSNPCNLKIYESGSGVVIKEYRNTEKLFSRMTALSEEIGKEEGIEGVYGEPVCNHPYSQKLCYNLKWITTAIETDLMPASAYQKEESAAGRVSAFWCFKTLVPKPHTVFIPEIYKDFFKLMYKRIDDKRDIQISKKSIPKTNSTIIKKQIFKFANVSRMAIQEIGQDLEEKLKTAEEDAQKKGVICFQAWLNLGIPYIGEAVEILRQNRYFLGGLLTRWFDTDGILMQKLITKPCWDDIVVAFEHDKIIVDTVYEDWKR